MNVPIQLECPSCGVPWVHRVHLSDPSLGFRCTKCRSTSYGIRALDATVGMLMLVRSWHELKIEKDYDMAIVLAATALDCELSYLFCKWRRIAALKADSPFSQEDCEGKLRDIRGGIAGKIDEVSGMLHRGGIESFVADSTEWSAAIKSRFPSLHANSLARDFQLTVFWPRNRVLHQGSADHTQVQASKCYSIAELGIGILKEMDKAKLRSSGL